ncbi:MAG: hypothetical protein ABIO02_00930 [Patescibacteria group bacterium]
MAKSKKAVRKSSTTRSTTSSANNSEASYVVQFGAVFIVMAAIVIAYIVGMKMAM